MNVDADKVRCHPRGGSEHQPSGGFTATRFYKVQILGPAIGEHRAGHAYGPKVCGF